MELRKLVASVFSVMFLLHHCVEVRGEAGVSIPLQLVAFPALIAMTRMVQFVKRLRYVLDPATYRSRSRRELAARAGADALDAAEVEKYIVGEFGSRACVFERACSRYAARARALPRPQMDWGNVLSQYKRSPDQNKEFFLLSVFLGDIVGSPALCHQLGKRRGCDPGSSR